MTSAYWLNISTIATVAALSWQTGIASLASPQFFQVMPSEHLVSNRINLLKADDDDTPKTRTAGTGSRREVETKSNDDDEPRSRTIGAGSRGICNPSTSNAATPATPSAEPDDLIPLSPERGVGVTTASHPTFFWYLPDAVPAVRFMLIDDQQETPLKQQEIQNPDKGIRQFTLPKDVAAPVPGRELYWTVEIICNSNNSSDNKVATAWIQYTPATPELTRKLQAVPAQLPPAEKLRQQAQTYRDAGLWYDALQALMKARTIAPTNDAIQQELSRLMAAENLHDIPVQGRPTTNNSR